MLEREGNLKLVVASKNDNAEVKPIIRQHIDGDAFVITDSSTNYYGLEKEYAGHETVNHFANEFVGNGNIHTNGIEGAFSMLKRSIVGTYHNLSPKHLFRYCNETSYRYNTRKMQDGQRFEMSLTNLEGRLSYKELIKKTEFTSEVLIAPEVPEISLNPKVKGRPVYQISNGEIVAHYPSIMEAARITGLKKESISRVLRGGAKATGGYQWKYA